MKPANGTEENPEDDDKHEEMKLFSFKKVKRFLQVLQLLKATGTLVQEYKN